MTVSAAQRWIAAAIAVNCSATLWAQQMDEALATLPLDEIAPAVVATTPHPATLPADPPAADGAGLLGDGAGLRRRLADQGILIDALVVADYGKVVRGGLDTQGSAFAHVFSLGLTLQSRPLLKIDGGVLYALFQQFDGYSAIDEAGSEQDPTTLNAGRDGAQLTELWWQQALAGEKLVIKAGKIDAESDFAVADFSVEFLSAGIGGGYTVAGIPTFPESAFGVDAFVYPAEHVYLAGGVFDGSAQRGRTTGSLGPQPLYDDQHGAFVIGEVGLTWNLGKALPGRARAAVWHHTGDFTRLDDPSDTASAAGYYLIVDQLLFREAGQEDTDAPQGLGVFVTFDAADEDVSAVRCHLSAGASYRGPLPGRDDDAAGVAAGAAFFADDAGARDDAEYVIEAFYRVQILPHLSLKPDLQYILNPFDASARDAIVASLRIEAAF